MASTPPPSRSGGALAFSDARTCKEWLNALPLTNIPQAQSMVLEALRALATAEFDPLDRLKCLELARDKIAFLQGEQRARYFGKSLPLSANDSDAWRTGRALLEEMETGYRAALAAAASQGGEIAAHDALIRQRIVRHVGAQMLFHAIVYRRFEPQLWTRLHQDFAAAERAGVAEERVKDSLESDDGASSVAEAYVQVVLAQAAYLSEMSGPQMDFASALLRMWARKVQVRAKPVEGAGAAMLPLAVDIDKPIGARPLAASELRDNHRLLDIEQLSRSMRRRIHGLQKEEDPATLGLPDYPAGDALAQLQRLHKLWCEGAPPRPPAKVPSEKIAGLAFGLNEIHFFVAGGKAFEQPDKKRELTRQEKQDLEVFGRVTERTQSMMVSDYNFSVENWGVIDEMMGAWRLQRPPTASKGVAIGRLVAMRASDTAPFFLGHVSALAQETDGRLIATITLFPGRPEPIPVRAADARNRASAQWGVGFRLPALERIKIAASLVVASCVASRGRGIEIWDGGPKESTVYEVLDHGTDFDRISIF
jgi:cyclic-di-GMP-binding protein